MSLPSLLLLGNLVLVRRVCGCHMRVAAEALAQSEGPSVLLVDGWQASRLPQLWDNVLDNVFKRARRRGVGQVESVDVRNIHPFCTKLAQAVEMSK